MQAHLSAYNRNDEIIFCNITYSVFIYYENTQYVQESNIFLNIS
jgi:hypothetical protein